MDNYIGTEVFNKRNGLIGTVTSQDPHTITIDIQGTSKSYTHSTFKRWWTVVPQEKDETEEQEPKETPIIVETEEVVIDGRGIPAGEKGIGVLLRDKFVQYVEESGLDNITIFHNADTKTDIIKYNGANVFECNYASRRFNVLAHPDSLTPLNRKKVAKYLPKEWGWSLRAKFIFTTNQQWPLMKSVISDGLFYRSRGIK